MPLSAPLPDRSDSLTAPPLSAPLIALDHAGFQERGRWLVRDVSFDVRPGEIVTLIGPNGSGKSTTMKMALGLLPPSAGHARQKPDLVVGYVPQHMSFDETLPLSVARFMELSAAANRLQINQALALSGAEHLREVPVCNLSGGELQRVLLARALARQPNLLVLDEPVQGVDFAGEIALYELILSIRDRSGCGILLISHDLHIVMAATDQVICLNGHVCCQGAPRDVASSTEYRRLFGDPAAALTIYSHDHDHEHHADGSICPPRKPHHAG